MQFPVIQLSVSVLELPRESNSGCNLFPELFVIRKLLTAQIVQRLRDNIKTNSHVKMGLLFLNITVVGALLNIKIVYLYV